MNAQIRTLIAALFSILASNAFGMTYPAPKPLPNLPSTLPPAPPPPPVSICTTESNTIAIGIEYYPNGARIVCADAGQIGFWTTPVLGAGTIGHPHRRICSDQVLHDLYALVRPRTMPPPPR